MAWNVEARPVEATQEQRGAGAPAKESLCQSGGLIAGVGARGQGRDSRSMALGPRKLIAGTWAPGHKGGAHAADAPSEATRPIPWEQGSRHTGTQRPC